MSTDTEERKVTDMTVEELRWLIEDAVSDVLLEWFGDPDVGLELRPEFVRLLRKRRSRFATSGDAVPLDEAFTAFESD